VLGGLIALGVAIGRGHDKVKRSGPPTHPIRMATVTGFPSVRTTERAVCELCGGVIATTNGGVYTGLRFILFERLLDLHMAERHPNVCVLPAARERKIAA
jgi:hypothetical protein